MSVLGSLFGPSPIRPMQHHMQTVVSCAREVLPLFEDMAAGRTSEFAARRREIDRLEHEVDRIKNEIRSHLPRRLFLAVERRDMLEILDFQDSIADVAQDIAGLADQRAMVIPPALADPLLALVRRVISACEQAERVIQELDELLEAGFAGREVGRVEEMINELCRMESETAALADPAQRQLFTMETELGIGAIFWYQMIEWVAEMADYAERVGNRLRLLIAR